ncbi:hypothetical protein BpHYR1_020417, partial [Brachionus plicatilis]
MILKEPLRKKKRGKAILYELHSSFDHFEEIKKKVEDVIFLINFDFYRIRGIAVTNLNFNWSFFHYYTYIITHVLWVKHGVIFYPGREGIWVFLDCEK